MPFSEAKMFAPVRTTQVELLFRIPGRDTVVLADVPVPVRADPDDYSLVGVTFQDPVIASGADSG